jgi:hypothetical protein
VNRYPTKISFEHPVSFGSQLLIREFLNAAMSRRRWSVAVACSRPGRAAVVALTLATVLTLLFACYAATGSLNSFPQILKPLLIPGIFGLYFVGTITGSMLLAYAAYVFCMAIVYLGIGTLADLMIRLRKSPFNGHNQ